MTSLLWATVVAAVVFAAGYCALLLARQRKARLALSAPLAGGANPAPLKWPPGMPLQKQHALVANEQTALARVTGLTMREAEDLLDWLEQHSCSGTALMGEAGGLLTVEFRPLLAEAAITPVPQAQRARPAPRTSVGS
jgi:hypothetical protein